MELQNNAGTRCLGDYVARSSIGGNGFICCNDGRQAAFQYTTTSVGVGYGYGTANTGDAVRFYFVMTAEQGAHYLEVAARPGEKPGAGGGGSKGGSGTGFFISRQGHILTNAHVVDGCSEVTVQQPGTSASAASIVAADKQNDLALLRTEMRAPAIAALRGDRAVRPGETVVAYGFPLTGLISSGGILTTGTVSALAGIHDDSRYLQISAPIQPGNSGGPLLDTSAAVVGVNSATLSNAAARQIGVIPQNVNFAIKTDVVRTFLSTNSISPETGAGRETSMPDIGERARAFTVHVVCRK